MGENIDRDKSKEAIAEKIKEEQAKIDKWNEDIKQRKKDGRPFDDLTNNIDNENARIAGKKKVSELVDGFSQMPAIEAEIKEEQELLKGKKKEIEELRGREPKPRSEIDKLAREIRLLENMIEGKGEAKRALIF
jgi:chromosome segregation ATPase